MIWYFLPGAGVFGGVKVACQFVELLSSQGFPITAVFPDGQAPQWFRCSAPTICEQAARARIRDTDWLMITWPSDYHRLKSWPGRLVCHYQGTDPLMDPVCADHSVEFLTCWRQAREYLATNFQRTSTDVGIAISSCFYFRGTRKFDNQVAYMPRRGFATVRRCMRRAHALDFRGIDGLHEAQVAQRLQASGIYLATAPGEWFGLPALEAMAAGCVVLSVPVRGGTEYLDDGQNCLIAEPDEMPAKLRWIAAADQAALRARLRCNAVATAMRYRPSIQRKRIADLQRSELAWLMAPSSSQT